MTDTGQVPGEGLPEDAGTVDQPGVPAPGAYTYLDPAAAPEDDDLLFMPGAQGAWTEGQPTVPPAPAPVAPQPAPAYAQQPAGYEQPGAAEPIPYEQVPQQGGHGVPGGMPQAAPAAVPGQQAQGQPEAQAPQGRHAQQGQPVPAQEQYQAAPQASAPHEPGPHETDGRDSGSVHLGDVRLPGPATPQQTGTTHTAPGRPVAAAPASGNGTHGGRRPLHMGPPASGPTASPVRSLADRGPAGAPAQPTAPVPPAQPAPESGPPTVGPEYLDVPHVDHGAPQGPQGATPWTPEPQPTQSAQGTHVPGAEALGAETVVPGAPQTTGVPQAPQGVPVAPGEPGGVPAAPTGVAAAPGGVAEQPQTEQPVGQFVPVEGQIPSTPHLAPTPPQPLRIPQDGPEGQAAQPAGEAQPEPVAQPEQEQPEQSAQPVAVEAEQPAAETADGGTPEAPEAVAPEAVAPEAVEQPAPAEAEAPAEAAPAGEAVATVPEPRTGEPAAPAAETPQHVPEAEAENEIKTEPATEDRAEAEAPAQAETEAAPEADDATAAPAEQSEDAAVQPQDAGAQPQADDATAAPAAPEGVPAEATAPATEADATAEAAQAVGEEAAPEAGPEAAPAQPEQPEAAAPEQPEAVAAAAEATGEAAPAAEDAADAVDAEPEAAPVGAPAPAYDEAEREAVLRVMRERRDIRNGFRSDPIPHEVLLRVLEAAHTAPSVGHSQPWDFVVIRSAETRRTMHELAMRQRDAYAKSLPKGRAKQFKELKIEAILDTPVNIVVTADPTRGGRHTLGRHTQPQMAPYSSALAVENLWLAARAEGLGVGWVSFFDEREMVRTLELPEHLEVVAYLCVGYVDEFPDEPELMQAGWSKRRPLSWVVHEETYGRRALPGEEPHDLLAETVANIRPLDAKALGEAWERQKRMTKPAGALGMLEIISAQLSGLSRMCPPPIPEPAAVAIFAGDHGVHAQGVTPWPQEVTGQMVANFLGGGAVCNAFANQVGAEVCVIDVGVASDLPATPGLLPRKVRAGTADMTTGPALTRDEVKEAIEVGIDTARDLVAAGNKALLTGEMGIANTTASAALISVFTGVDPAEVTGRGTGINDETLARKTDVVRRALELHQPDPADPIGVLAAIGGLEHAAMVGLLLGGASLRTPVILDGVSAGAAALVARAIAPEVLAACIAGHRSAEPGHVAALNKLGLRPLVDLDLRLGEGTGALLALPVVQSAARAMHEVATFDSAGVTEK